MLQDVVHTFIIDRPNIGITVFAVTRNGDMYQRVLGVDAKTHLFFATAWEFVNEREA